MKKALIVGAGAIGRGFLAGLIAKEYSIDFVESDQRILSALREKKSYFTATVADSGYVLQDIPFNEAFHPDDITSIKEYDAVFLSVGCRACLEYKELLRDAKIIFMLENDRALVEQLKRETGNDNIYFCIPDVITSNTAPQRLRDLDAACLVTEQGILVVEAGNHDLQESESIVLLAEEELTWHWLCKFYIHNAPHAMAAFFGAMREHTYVHEAMHDQQVGLLIEQAMRIITSALIRQELVPEDFAIDYMRKELRRFKNQLLYDPISRVARDPLRKLDKNNRMIQALHIVRDAGIDTTPIHFGIEAALRYRGSTEADERFIDYLKDHSYDDVLQDICGLEDRYLRENILTSGTKDFLLSKKQERSVIAAEPGALIAEVFLESA